MIRSLAGLFFVLTLWGHCQAAILWLKSDVKVKEGFVRLSDLMVDPDGDRFDNLFCGQIKLDEEKKVYLSYIMKRLNRFGYLTLTPKVKNGHDFVVVKAVSEEQYAASKPKQPMNKLTHKMVVVKESLTRGTILRADMLELVPLDEKNNDAYAKIEEVLGYELERNMTKGAAIKPRYISRPPLIRKGDAVKIIIRSPGIEISGLAKALEDGNLGETIDVRRQHESLQAKILDEQTVLVQGPK